MSNPEKSNVLYALSRACTPEERTELAELAGTTENYLYILAAQTREPGIELASRISEASKMMSAKTNGRIPVVTLDEMAAMWRSA